MAYGDDIDALNPNHRWAFDGDYVDAVGSSNGSSSSMVTTGSPISEDATNSVYSNGTTDRVAVTGVADMNTSAHSRRAMTGWFMVSAIQTPPCRIYGEGDNDPCFQISLGYGNNITFEATDVSNFINQVYSDTALTTNRAYHLCMRFSGNGYSNEFTAFVDGVECTDAEPSDRQPDTASFTSGGNIEFGDPASTSGVGGDVVTQVASVNGYYNQWASWSAADAESLTNTQIREELFEKGALPGITISSGTQGAMQTSLDAYADTVRGNEPLNIRISTVTGDGDLSLDADNITHNTLASIHIQYMGTGTLTWTNSNGSDASIGSTPAGGTILFVTPVTVTVKALDSSDFTPIDGAQVLLEADAGGDLAEGTDILTGTTNASGIITTSTFGYSTDQPVKGRVRKGTASPFYQTAMITGTITSAGLVVTVLSAPDSVAV